MPQSQKGEIVLQFVKDYETKLREGEISKSGLARLIYKDYPDLFNDAEDVRDKIRTYTGAHGDKSRSEVKEGYTFKSDIEHGQKANKIPESLAEEKKDFILPTGKKYLVLSDIHFPFHTEEALNEALIQGKDCDAVYLNGDTLDFYFNGRFMVDPRMIKKFDLRTEIEYCRDFLEYLSENFEKVYFKVGNHCERWQKYIWKNAERLSDLPDFDLENILQLGKNNVGYVESQQAAMLGDTVILHGHEKFGMFTPLNVGQSFAKWWQQVSGKLEVKGINGHHHISQDTILPNLDKTNAEWHTSGCLCTLTPSYRLQNRWNHGFMILDSNEDGKTQINNIKL